MKALPPTRVEGQALPDMVEIVARAMAIADGCDPDDPAYVRYPGPTYIGVCWRDKYASKARAAITAMRETTLVYRQNGEVVHQLIGAPDDIWKTLLDAALSPTPAQPLAEDAT